MFKKSEWYIRCASTSLQEKYITFAIVVSHFSVNFTCVRLLTDVRAFPHQQRHVKMVVISFRPLASCNTPQARSPASKQWTSVKGPSTFLTSLHSSCKDFHHFQYELINSQRNWGVLVKPPLRPFFSHAWTWARHCSCDKILFPTANLAEPSKQNYKLTMVWQH